MLLSLLRPQPATEDRSWQGLFPTDPRDASLSTPVSEVTTLALPAAWRCVTLLCDSIASLPIDALRAGDPIAQPSLLARPNSLETRFDTVSKIVYSLVLRGNAYALLGDFDRLGFPRQLEVVHPGNVTVVLERGEVVYRVGGTVVPRSELLHVRGLTIPGELTGLGVVEAHRRGISRIASQEDYGSRQWTESAVPSVTINVDDPDLSKADADAIKRQWVSTHGGGSRQPAVLSSKMTVTPLSFSPEDAQFIESRQFSLQEVANMFGIAGWRVGAPGSAMTYQNVNADELIFVRHTLRPWITRIEQSLSDLLPRGTEVRFNLDAMLRGTTGDRYTAHAIALANKWITIEEVRSLEDLPALPVSSSDAGSTPRDLAEMVQKVYLGVGVVLTAEEARQILNAAGAGLTGPPPTPETTP